MPGVRRAIYRVWQFVVALLAAWSPLSPEESEAVRFHLPKGAWSLFSRMSRSDQRHSLRVWRFLEGGGDCPPPFAQAALLHDCAKAEAGVQLWHRVAVVVLRACCPALLAEWASGAAPARHSWRYPFWAHLHHPARGAELAARVGCDPLAVLLIEQHQNYGMATGLPEADRWLRVLQAADDDN